MSPCASRARSDGSSSSSTHWDRPTSTPTPAFDLPTTTLIEPRTRVRVRTRSTNGRTVGEREGENETMARNQVLLVRESLANAREAIGRTDGAGMGMGRGGRSEETDSLLRSARASLVQAVTFAER